MFRYSIPCLKIISTNISKQLKRNISIRNVPKQIWQSAFDKHLLLTNTVTYGLFMFVGDSIQQMIEMGNNNQKRPINWERSGHMFLVGLTLGAPSHYYYKYLALLLPSKSFHSIVKKVGIEQLIVTPIIIVWFYYAMGICEKRSFQDIQTEVKEKFMVTYLVDCGIWIPAQYFNFYFLPVKYQVVFMNVIGIIYNVILSYLKYNEPTIQMQSK